MKRYMAFFRSELETAMAYRGDFFFSFLADFILILVKLAVWSAVFQHRSTVAGFDFAQMMTYLFVSQTVTNIYAFKNDASRPISSKIRKGTIVFDLLRPVEFTKARLFENLGQTMVVAMFNLAFLLGCILLIPNVDLPASFACAGLFVLSMVCGYVIMFCVCLLSGLLTFWTMNSWGMRNIRNAIIAFFSGSLVPIGALPEWMQGICNVLPFKSIIYTPTMIYMGQYDVRESLIQISVQLFWAAFLWIAARLLCGAALKRVQVNGG